MIDNSVLGRVDSSIPSKACWQKMPTPVFFNILGFLPFADAVGGATQLHKNHRVTNIFEGRFSQLFKKQIFARKMALAALAFKKSKSFQENFKQAVANFNERTIDQPHNDLGRIVYFTDAVAVVVLKDVFNLTLYYPHDSVSYPNTSWVCNENSQGQGYIYALPTNWYPKGRFERIDYLTGESKLLELEFASHISEAETARAKKLATTYLGHSNFAHVQNDGNLFVVARAIVSQFQLSNKSNKITYIKHALPVDRVMSVKNILGYPTEQGPFHLMINGTASKGENETEEKEYIATCSPEGLAVEASGKFKSENADLSRVEPNSLLFKIQGTKLVAFTLANKKISYYWSAELVPPSLANGQKFRLPFFKTTIRQTEDLVAVASKYSSRLAAVEVFDRKSAKRVFFKDKLNMETPELIWLHSNFLAICTLEEKVKKVVTCWQITSQGSVLLGTLPRICDEKCDASKVEVGDVRIVSPTLNNLVIGVVSHCRHTKPHSTKFHHAHYIPFRTFVPEPPKPDPDRLSVSLHPSCLDKKEDK